MPETSLNAPAKHSAATCRCNASGLLLEEQLHQRLPALYPRPRTRDTCSPDDVLELGAVEGGAVQTPGAGGGSGRGGHQQGNQRQHHEGATEGATQR